MVEIEKNYEEILLHDLVKRYFRFRVRSYYNAYSKLKSELLYAFDEDGMVNGEDLTGVSPGDGRGYLADEFDTVYFLPVSMKLLIDGEEVIKRLCYFYTGKDKPVRVRLMKELLADYRERFRKPHEAQPDGLPLPLR